MNPATQAMYLVLEDSQYAVELRENIALVRNSEKQKQLEINDEPKEFDRNVKQTKHEWCRFV